MFAARCIGVSLAVFVLVYVFLSLLVSRGWKLMRRTLQPTSARSAADLLFILRVLPPGVSVFVTLAFTLPSFLLLEPRSTGEAIGTAPLALGFAVWFCSVRELYAQRWLSSGHRERWLPG